MGYGRRMVAEAKDSRGIGAKLAAERVAFVRWDFGFGNELRHLVSHASGQVPHVTVTLS